MASSFVSCTQAPDPPLLGIEVKRGPATWAPDDPLEPGEVEIGANLHYHHKHHRQWEDLDPSSRSKPRQWEDLDPRSNPKLSTSGPKLGPIGPKTPEPSGQMPNPGSTMLGTNNSKPLHISGNNPPKPHGPFDPVWPTGPNPRPPGTLPQGPGSGCEKRIRKSAHELSKSEIKDLTEAMKSLIGDGTFGRIVNQHGLPGKTSGPN